MDQPSLDPRELNAALADLARLNRLFGGWRVVQRSLNALIPAGSPIPVKILDVGTGSGDIPVHIALWAQETGRSMRITAVDRNPRSLAIGKGRAHEAHLSIQFVQADVKALPFRSGQFDIVLASQFLHHFAIPEASGILRCFGELARRAVIISDLQRNRFSLTLTYLGTRLFTRSPIVHHDSLVSIRRGFLPEELEAIAREAGYPSPRVASCFPCRLLLVARM